MATGSIFIPQNARTLNVRVWAPGGLGGTLNGTSYVTGQSGGQSQVLGLTVNGGGGGAFGGGGGGTASGGTVNISGVNGQAGQETPFPAPGAGGAQGNLIGNTPLPPSGQKASAGLNGGTGNRLEYTYFGNTWSGSQTRDLWDGSKYICRADGGARSCELGRPGNCPTENIAGCQTGYSYPTCACGSCLGSCYNTSSVAGAGGGGGEGGYASIIYDRAQLEALGWLNTTQSYTYSTSGVDNGLVLINVSTSNMLVKQSDSWSRVQDVYIKDGGAWKKVQKIYIKNNSGNWTNVL